MKINLEYSGVPSATFVKRARLCLVSKIGGFSLALLVVLALVLPTTWIPLKALLLLVALVSVVILGFAGYAKFSSRTLVACGLFALVGIGYSALGLSNDAPGAIRVLSVYAVWPLLYGLLSPILSFPRLLDRLSKLLSAATLLVCTHSILVVGAGAGWLSPDFIPPIELGSAFGQYEGFSEFNLWSISSMLFLVPWVMHRMIVTILDVGICRRFVSVALLASVGLLVTLLSGRRALLLTVFAAPALAVLSEVLLGRPWRSIIVRFKIAKVVPVSLVLIGCFAVASLLFELSLAAMWQQVLSGFDFFGNSELSANARGEQLVALLDGWQHSGVLFGAGNGSAVELNRGGDDQSWAYELTYVYLLYSTGLAGVSFYGLWFYWGVMRMNWLCRNQPVLRVSCAPLLTGVLCFMIGNASNPYLAKFDYLWIAFLPHLIAGALGSSGVTMRSSKAEFSRCQDSSDSHLGVLKTMPMP